MPTLPSTIALANIADGALILASDHRNNYSSVQTAVNQLITTLAAGANGQVLQGSGSFLSWVGGMAQIGDTTLGAPAAQIDFQNIPQTFAHLLALITARGDVAATLTALNLRCNGDVGANYWVQGGQASAATMTAAESLSQTLAIIGYATGATAIAGYQGSAILFVPNYTAATPKTMLNLSGILTSGGTGGQVFRFGSAEYAQSLAVNRLTFLPGGGNFIAGSRVTLYGMG